MTADDLCPAFPSADGRTARVAASSPSNRPPVALLERQPEEPMSEPRERQIAEAQSTAITAWLAQIIHEAHCHATDCPNVQPSEQRLASLIATELKPTSTWYGGNPETQFSTPFLRLAAPVSESRQ